MSRRPAVQEVGKPALQSERKWHEIYKSAGEEKVKNTRNDKYKGNYKVLRYAIFSFIKIYMTSNKKRCI